MHNFADPLLFGRINLNHAKYVPPWPFAVAALRADRESVAHKRRRDFGIVSRLLEYTGTPIEVDRYLILRS